MSSNESFQSSMKSLVKIIYEKQKQIQKYKNLLSKSQTSKITPFADQSNISKQIKQASKMISALQRKVDYVNGLLQEQIQQNSLLEEQNEMLQNEIECLKDEKLKMMQNENLLKQEIQKIDQLNKKIQQQYNNQVSKKEEQFNTSIKYKDLLEKINNSNQKMSKQYQNQIENYELKVQKLQNQLNQMQDKNKQNIQFQSRKLQEIINKKNIEIKQLTSIKNENLDIKKQLQAKLDQIHHQLSKNKIFISKVEDQIKQLSCILKMQNQQSQNKISRQQFILKVLSLTKKHLQQEQKRINHNQTDFLINQTLHGISCIKESFQEKLDQLNEDQFNTSQFQINQDILIQNLQKQCQNQSNHSKLVQLSQVKQNLKMTKQVNMQLFDQINRQQKVIREFKSSFRNFLSINKQKLLNLEQIKTISQLISQH